MPKKNIEYADDDYESIGTLFKLRFPALLVGLVLGTGISFVTSNFEEVLIQNVHVAFFLPFVVYIADAIGTQTESIYSRDLKTGKTHFRNYLHKEFALGILFGVLFAIFSGGITYFWLHDYLLALTVAIATCIVLSTAPLIALFVTQIFQTVKQDPAASSGPIATVIQDMASVVIYGLVATAILL